MKHKLTYSLLLSLVVLFSFDLALAQNVSVVGPASPLNPSTAYNFDVVLDNGTGITAFTLPVSISGAGYLSGSVSVTLGVATVFTIVGDQVLLGYTGPDLGAGPLILATLTVTTTNLCGESFSIDAGSLAPAGGRQFAGGLGCAVATQFAGITRTLYDGTPFCGQNGDENLVCGGSIVNKQINATEPIGLPLTYTLITGPGTVGATGLYNYTPAGSSCDFSALVEVEVMNPCGNADTCFFNVNYNQAAPVIAIPGDYSYHWLLGPQLINIGGTDDACPTPHNLVFTIESVVPPLASIIINSVSGQITVDPACADIAGSTHTVTVRVSDGCEYDEGTFFIDVTNTAPLITCPPNTSWYSYLGNITLPFTASDPNGDPIVVTFAGFLKDGQPAANPGMILSGPPYKVDWDPSWADEGVWDITLQVDDGCQQTTCTYQFTVIGKFFLCMDSVSVLSGYNATVTLSITNSVPGGIGGLDLLLTYGLGGLNFLYAEAIGDLTTWEYFTFRKSAMDMCGGGCPTGVIHLIGIADMPNGTSAGINFSPAGGIVKLVFSTPQDLSFIGQCFHLSWRWFECGDNAISSKGGDTLWVAQWMNDTTYLDGQFCLEGFQDKGIVPMPKINFCNGMICIIPPPDDRGDLNLNGIPNEIADAVLYSNYFIYGPEVLGYGIDPYFENRVLASDVNDDGTPLTIADLVYLIRIITGDANPYPESGEGGKVAPYATAADVSYLVGEKTTVSAFTTADVGGAAFVFRHTGTVSAPVIGDAYSNMTLKWSDRNGELRVLIYSMDHSTVKAGAHQLFTVPMGEGTMELVEAQFSDAQGNMMAVSTAKGAVPTVYELSQNYPNPFNAGTVIRFALPQASDWTLRIYNVAGQLVNEFKGHGEGWQSQAWNPEKAASGIYFYKLFADSFTDTKKMVLMK